MIFPVIVNRWGIVGGLGTMALYGVLVASILLVAARSKDPFAHVLCGLCGHDLHSGFD